MVLSNYPQSYGSYQSYGGYGNFSVGFSNSGPPPPPMGGAYGGYGSYGGYGGGYQQVNPYSSYQAGSFTCPAMQQMSSGYPMGNQPPPQPPQPPMSYSHQPYVQHQMEMNMQRHMYQQMGFQAPKPPAPEGQEQADEPAEEETDKPLINDEVKAVMKNMYLDELMKRYAVSSTFEVVSGTVLPMLKYREDDMVAKYYREKRDQEIGGEDWDPEYDCEYLNVAMKGPGTTESIITHIVATRCNEQRQKLKEMFITMYGRDLIKEIKSELSGDYKSAILACFVSPAEFDAWCIKDAIYGLGTNELALIEILMTRTNKQIKAIRQVYGKVARPDDVTYETLLNQDIEDDTSGDFKRLLVSCAQGNRKELTRSDVEKAVEEITNANGDGTGMFELNPSKLANKKQAQRDAQALFEAGEDRWGTDEEVFNKIFAIRDFYQLRETYKQYVKISQADIRHAIDSETSGNYRKGLYAVAQSVMNRPKFFAEKLRNAMKGLGTDEKTLIRIVASRSEIDMIQIKAEFRELTKKSLYRYIDEDTSFNFKKILLSLVKKDFDEENE